MTVQADGSVRQRVFGNLAVAPRRMRPVSDVADGATGRVIAVAGFIAKFLSRFGVSPGGGRLSHCWAHTIARRLFARWARSPVRQRLCEVGGTGRHSTPVDRTAIRLLPHPVKENFHTAGLQSKPIQAWMAKLVSATENQVAMPSSNGRVPAPAKARQWPCRPTAARATTSTQRPMN
jgi:hypothetical protein